MVEDLIKAINHFIIVFSFRGKRKLKTKKYIGPAPISTNEIHFF